MRRQLRQYPLGREIRRFFQQYWIALSVGLIATVIVFGLQQQLLVQEQLHIQQLVQQEATAIQSELSRELSARVVELERMADRWAMSNGTSLELWEEDAENYLRHSYSYQAIQWVDPSFRARWVMPLQGNEAALNFDFRNDPRREVTLRIARDLRQTTLTKKVILAQGDPGFLVCIPLFVSEEESTADRFDGFIVGVFRFQTFFESTLTTSPRYKVKIYDRDDLIYHQGEETLLSEGQGVIVQAYSVDWQVQVFPNLGLIFPERSLLPNLVFWGGLVGGWTLALAMYLGQRSVKYARRVKNINQQLKDEILSRQQVEASLRESEERWQLVLRGNNDGIWDWNVQTNEVFYSSRWKKMLGFEDHEICHNFEEWEKRMHPDDLGWVVEEIQNHFARKTPFYIAEYRILCKDGVYKWVLDRGQALWDEAGNVIRMTGSHTDITERKQAEKELKHQKEMFQSIVNHIPVMITLLSAKGEMEFINPYLEQVLGWSLEEWQQTDVLSKCYPDELYRQRVIEHMRGATGKWKNLTTLTKTGESIEISLANVRLSNGSNVGIAQDISEQQAALRERKRKEIILRHAMEAAEAANLAKTVFLANMSHELRTPLNVILGFAQVMARDPALTPSQQQDLETIRRSGDHLLKLINNVLDLSKIEAGQFTLEEAGLDLISLLHSLRIMMAEPAKAKRISLEFQIAPEVPQFIIADAHKLRQILLNLLSNAIKFTKEGGVTLRVNAQTGEKKGNLLSLEFTIIDTGVGIAPEELNTIFNVFVQAEAGKKANSGTGLGLAISRRLIELMGGTITVSSDLHRGSSFRFSIPTSATSGVDIQSEQKCKIVGLVEGQPQRRILVVDDQQENRLLMMRLMTQLELEVREARNGQEAVQIWQDWQPDLIWMDIRMPILDGYEATRQIRSLEQGKGTIIIALTAHASQSDRVLALSSGCNDYITKPFQEETLFLKMREYLELVYIYADSHASSSTPTVAPAENENLFRLLNPALLPPDWLDHLEDAAICGNDRAIAELATQLSPEANLLATYLTELGNQFQFEKIIKLIHSYPTSDSLRFKP